MIELFGIDWGTPFQFLTALFSGGLLAAVLTFVVNNRRISVDAAGALRGHLMQELERMADRMTAAEARQRECEQREEQLRTRVRKVEDELEGVYRTLIATSADKVLEMGDSFPEHIREAAARTIAAQERRHPTQPPTLEQLVRGRP